METREPCQHPSSYLHGCECGYYGDTQRVCTCPRGSVARYLSRISGPILDRIDIHIEVPRLRPEELTGPAMGEKSAAIRARVEKAREAQRKRFTGDTAASARRIHGNAHMDPRHLREFCSLSDDALSLLRAAIEQMGIYSCKVPMDFPGVPRVADRASARPSALKENDGREITLARL